MNYSYKKRGSVAVSFFCLFSALVKRRIECIDIFLIQRILCHVQRITETLIVNDLPLSEEFQGIAHIGIVNKAQEIVVGDSCLLLCCNRIYYTIFSAYSPITHLIGNIVLQQTVSYTKIEIRGILINPPNLRSSIFVLFPQII